MNSAAFERVESGFDERVVHADGSDLNLKLLDPKVLFQFLLAGMPSLRAQAANALVGVVAGKRRQIHTGNRPQKPRRLPIFFHRPSRDMGLSAPLDRAGVDPHFPHPIEVKRNASIRQQSPPTAHANLTPPLLLLPPLNPTPRFPC